MKAESSREIKGYFISYQSLWKGTSDLSNPHVHSMTLFLIKTNIWKNIIKGSIWKLDTVLAWNYPWKFGQIAFLEWHSWLRMFWLKFKNWKWKILFLLLLNVVFVAFRISHVDFVKNCNYLDIIIRMMLMLSFKFLGRALALQYNHVIFFYYQIFCLSWSKKGKKRKARKKKRKKRRWNKCNKRKIMKDLIFQC